MIARIRVGTQYSLPPTARTVAYLDRDDSEEENVGLVKQELERARERLTLPARFSAGFSGGFSAAPFVQNIGEMARLEFVLLSSTLKHPPRVRMAWECLGAFQIFDQHSYNVYQCMQYAVVQKNVHNSYPPLIHGVG